MDPGVDPGVTQLALVAGRSLRNNRPPCPRGDPRRGCRPHPVRLPPRRGNHPYADPRQNQQRWENPAAATDPLPTRRGVSVPEPLVLVACPHESILVLHPRNQGQRFTRRSSPHPQTQRRCRVMEGVPMGTRSWTRRLRSALPQPARRSVTPIFPLPCPLTRWFERPFSPPLLVPATWNNPA